MRRLILFGNPLVVCIYLSIDSLCFAQDIRDVRPPVDPPFNFLLLFIILILLIGISFGLIMYFRKRRPVRGVIDEQTVRIAPWDIAYESLEALKQEDLPGKGIFMEYTVRISDIVRQYIENQFDIHAPEMTTEEFFYSLKDRDVLNPQQKDSLKEFLEECDMVKFAKLHPSRSRMDLNFLLAVRLVDETKEQAACVPEV